MNLSIKQIGAISGVVLSISAIAAGLGYGWPWYARAEGVNLERAVKDFEAAQSRHDKQIDSNLDLLTLERLRDEAKLANEKADKNPHSAEAKADAWFAQRKLDIFFKAHPSLAEAMH